MYAVSEEQTVFLWQITMQFYIVHVHIWSLVYLFDTKKGTIQLMNSMCDLTQVVISSLIRNINTKILAKNLMEEVALSFWMTAVIVVDAESKFISVFEDMCTALKMHLWPLAQGNQKLPSVDKCHKFINNKKLSYVKIEEGIYLSYKMPKIPNVLGIAHQYKI